MKKWICVFLSAAMLFALGGAAGCKDKEPEEGASAENLPYYTVNDFETLDDVRKASAYYNWTESAALNDKAEYITSGERSVRLNVGSTEMTGRIPTARPVFAVLTSSMNNPALSKTDFTDVDRFSVDVYNAEEQASNMTFAYSYKPNSYLPYGGSVHIALQPGWNYVSIPFPREAAAQAFDIKNIDTFFFIFDIPPKGETRELYFDNFRAHKAENAMGSYTKTRKAGEVFCFDAESDIKAMFFRNVMGLDYPALSYNVDRRFIKGGEGSLRMDIYPMGMNGMMGRYDSPEFGFFGPDVLAGARDFSKYEALTFSYFNDSDQDLTIVCYVRDGKAGYAKPAVLKKRNWTDVVIPISELAQAAAVIDDETVYLNTADIRQITFAYNGFSHQGPMTVYMDEIRLI